MAKNDTSHAAPLRVPTATAASIAAFCLLIIAAAIVYAVVGG